MRTDLLRIGKLLKIDGSRITDLLIVFADEFEIHNSNLLTGVCDDVLFDSNYTELVFFLINFKIPGRMMLVCFRKAFTQKLPSDKKHPSFPFLS